MVLPAARELRPVRPLVQFAQRPFGIGSMVRKGLKLCKMRVQKILNPPRTTYPTKPCQLRLGGLL